MTIRGTPLLGPLTLTLSASIWGTMFVVSAVVLRTVPVFVLLELRFVLALVVLACVAWWTGRLAIRRRDVGLMALLGLVGYTITIGLVLIGTALSGAALASLISAASPALIAVFAVWLLRERLTLRTGLAMIVGLVGIVVVVGLPGKGSGGTLEGNVILAITAVTWAAYTVLSRVGTRRYGSLTVTTWASIFGVLFSLPIAVYQQATQPWLSHSTPALWLGIVYLGVVCTAGAFFLWNKGFEYMPAGSGGMFILTQPVVGSLLGWALLGEQLGISFLVGGLLIVVGVILATMSAPETAPDEKPATDRGALVS